MLKKTHRANLAPLVSVVMPCLNQAQFLEVAVRSVLDRDYQHVELIVSDGMQIDGSIDLLVKLQAQYGDRLRQISELDTGVAQVVNKALALAHGGVVGWLNSDDIYMKGAVAQAFEHFQTCEAHQMVYALVAYLNAEGFVTGIYPIKAPSTPIDIFDRGSFIC